jgi:hypothetical protein
MSLYAFLLSVESIVAMPNGREARLRDIHDAIRRRIDEFAEKRLVASPMAFRNELVEFEFVLPVENHSVALMSGSERHQLTAIRGQASVRAAAVRLDRVRLVQRDGTLGLELSSSELNESLIVRVMSYPVCK